MTRYNPAIHHRQSIRLCGYDYRRAGMYFVTLCTRGREPVFGEIVGGTLHLNAYGMIVAEDWMGLTTQFGYVELDTYVVMPNHLHGIIVVNDHVNTVQAVQGDAGAMPESPTRTEKRLPLGRIVGTFKTLSAKHVNEWRETPGVALWQRNYYEHIVRDDEELARVREYIVANPARWDEDSENTRPVPSRT